MARSTGPFSLSACQRRGRGRPHGGHRSASWVTGGGPPERQRPACVRLCGGVAQAATLAVSSRSGVPGAGERRVHGVERGDPGNTTALYSPWMSGSVAAARREVGRAAPGSWFRPRRAALGPLAWDHWPGTTGLGPLAWDHRPGTTGLGPPAWDHRPGTTGLGPPAWDHRPGTTGLGPPAWDHRPGTTGLGPPAWEHCERDRPPFGRAQASPPSRRRDAPYPPRAGRVRPPVLGRPLVLALTAAGYDVREVQANRTAERRKRRRRAKTDIEDAEAIARETATWEVVTTTTTCGPRHLPRRRPGPGDYGCADWMGMSSATPAKSIIRRTGESGGTTRTRPICSVSNRVPRVNNRRRPALSM